MKQIIPSASAYQLIQHCTLTDIKVVSFIPSLSTGRLTSVRLQQPQEQRYPRTEGKCLTISIWLDTSERVVTCCQCQWPHTTRLKELWRVASSNDLTRHVWKSCDVLSVPMTSHDTSERVVTCCQCQGHHTTRLSFFYFGIRYHVSQMQNAATGKVGLP